MSTNWETPQDFFARLDKVVGGFAIDAAATSTNTKCEKWFGPGSSLSEDALSVGIWPSPAFCNPPYVKGKEWLKWLEKFNEQGQLGVKIITILPAKVGTFWWYKYIVQPQNDVIFLVGRLPFTIPESEKPSQPNHDSALVIFGPDTQGKTAWLNWTASPENPEENAPTAP